MDVRTNAARLGTATLALALGLAVGTGQAPARAETEPGETPAGEAAAEVGTPPDAAAESPGAASNSPRGGPDSSAPRDDTDEPDPLDEIPAGELDEPRDGTDRDEPPDGTDLDEPAPQLDDPEPADLAPQPEPDADTDAGGAPAGPEPAPRDPGVTVAVPARTAGAESGTDGGGLVDAGGQVPILTPGVVESGSEPGEGDQVPDEPPSGGPSSGTVELGGGGGWSPIAELVALPVRIVTGVLGLLGFAPVAALPAPGLPANPLGSLLEFVFVALRRVQSLLFNAAPTAVVKVGEPGPDGVVTGTVVGFDPDGDPLEYRIVAGPSHGSVTIDAHGNFTYTPDGLVSADSFRIAVIDKGFHLHGLLGWLRPGGGHSTVVTVQVVNDTPALVEVTRQVDHTTGVVTATVRLTDRDGRPVAGVSVLGPDPELGTVELVALDDAGLFEWRFVPRPEARTGAGPDDVAVFTLVAMHGGRPYPLTLQAPIVPDDGPVGYLETTIVNLNNPIDVVPLPDGYLVLVPEPVQLHVSPDLVLTPTELTLIPDYVVPAPQPMVVTVTGELTITSGVGLTPVGVRVEEPITGVARIGDSYLVSGRTGLRLMGVEDLGGVIDIPVGGDEVTTIWQTGADTVAAAGRHAVSSLMVLFDLTLGARGVAAATTGAHAEVLGTVDFGDAEVGHLVGGPGWLAVSVTGADTTEVVFIDTVTDWGEPIFEAGATIEVAGEVAGMAVSPDGGTLYILERSGTLSVHRVFTDYDQPWPGLMGTVSIDGAGRVTALSDRVIAVTDTAAGTVRIIELDPYWWG